MSMEHWWNDNDMGKPKYPERTLAQMPLCAPQIPHGLPWGRIWSVGERPGTHRLSLDKFRVLYVPHLVISETGN